MSARAPAINLQFGQSGFSYQDVILGATVASGRGGGSRLTAVSKPAAAKPVTVTCRRSETGVETPIRETALRQSATFEVGPRQGAPAADGSQLARAISRADD